MIEIMVAWQVGVASVYWEGGRLATGERFYASQQLVAHRSLPLGSWVEVRAEGHCLQLQVRDRGPYVKGRVLDLSLGAARALGVSGTPRIQWRALSGKGEYGKVC